MPTKSPRLSGATLNDARGALLPAYDRARVTTGVVHLGVGAFHRAHQAVYTEAAIAAGDDSWGILGASLRSPDTRDALAPQDGLYALAVRDAGGERLQIVGALRQLLVAPENPEALIAAMARAAVRVVSLTVTEKGYCHDPATGALDESHPDVRHDLANPDAPRGAPGYLLAALARRRAKGLPPFTVLCCDNLPANGKTVKGVLTRLAELRDRDFGRYVAGEVACPSTMVDRIVPATSDEDRARIAGALGLRDAWPIVTEPFSQWVIEDDFPQGRPDWALAGATFAADVAPYETMKLRLLNGAHSAIAYLGQLAGYETVAAAMDDPNLAAFIRALMSDELGATVAPPPGFDVPAYRDALIARFRNPALRHRTAQIAMDGSQKLPQRWLAALRHLLADGRPTAGLALCVAAWMGYVAGVGETGAKFELCDPLAAELRRRSDSAGLDAERLIAALLSLEPVFGRDLAVNAAFAGAARDALADLLRFGARETLARRARA